MLCLPLIIGKSPRTNTTGRLDNRLLRDTLAVVGVPSLALNMLRHVYDYAGDLPQVVARSI